MARPLLIRSETNPYHVTSRSNNKEFFPIPLREVWVIMMEQLQLEVRENALAIHAFILMGNHFHLLCHTPKGNIDQVMQRFLRMTSVKINNRSRSINHLWGGRYKWSLIESQTHYFQVYRYIFQNPIRAKICHRVEAYPFSTLHSCPIPLHSFIPMSFGGHEGELIWLNEVFDREDQEIIKLGLKKQQFHVSKRNFKLFNKLNLPSKR